MTMDRWQPNPMTITIIRQGGLLFSVTDSDWLVDFEIFSVQSSLPLPAWDLASGVYHATAAYLRIALQMGFGCGLGSL